MTLATGVTRNHAAIPALDGFRALAILIVMLSHIGLQHIVPGQFGVTLFFFLSGYLITTLLRREIEAEGGIDFRRFYLRRAVRILPPMYVTIAFIAILSLAGVVHRINLVGLPYDFLFLTNYFPISGIPIGLWSLAVEEHFYIFYPMIMSLLLRRSLRPATIGMVLAGFCVAILLWRIHLVQSEGFIAERTYYSSDTRIDSIIYGCLLAVLVNPLRHLGIPATMSLPQWALFVAALGIVLLTFVYRGPFFRETFRYSLQGIALLPIFYFAIRFHDNAVFRHLNSHWMVKLGVWSYAIYLIHQIVIYFIGANFPRISTIPLLLLPIALCISIGYAVAVDRLVDTYFRKLRQRYRSHAVAVV